MEQPKSARQIAQERFELIAPLLEPDIEPAEKKARRDRILERQQALGAPISARTLRRYVQHYREHGLEGLEPKTRRDQGELREISRDILDDAKVLKAELPQRSIRQILEILETEGKITPGSVSHTTLGRHLRKLGFMGLPKVPKNGFKRFQKEYRNQLWQVDLKYGPFIPDPKNPKKNCRTYLLAFIDDHTRLITHGQFYLDQSLPILEDCFRKAILKRGIPDNVYVDNGKIFVSRWFRLACARLNIRHRATAPFSPKSKGKIERFMGTVDQFVNEVSLSKPQTLKDLNNAFLSWLEEGYNHKPHSALNGQTPASVFAGDTRKLRFASPEELRDAFLWEESRKIDKVGCIKLNGLRFDVGPDLVGRKVDVRFDPLNLDAVEIWFNGQKIRLAKELKINADREWKTDSVEVSAPTDSRYLKALEQKEKERRKLHRNAISFHKLEGDSDV